DISLVPGSHQVRPSVVIRVTKAQNREVEPHISGDALIGVHKLHRLEHRVRSKEVAQLLHHRSHSPVERVELVSDSIGLGIVDDALPREIAVDVDAVDGAMSVFLSETVSDLI